MPETSSYITVTGTEDYGYPWTNAGNASAAPDAAVATNAAVDGEELDGLIVSHALTVPAGASLTGMTITLRAALDLESQLTFDLQIYFNGKYAGSDSAAFADGAGGALEYIVLTWDRAALETRGITPDDINAGVGEIIMAIEDADDKLSIDAIQIDIEYALEQRGRRARLQP